MNGKIVGYALLGGVAFLFFRHGLGPEQKAIVPGLDWRDEPPSEIVDRVMLAFATGDPAQMRAEASKLRGEGWTLVADALDAGARFVEGGGFDKGPKPAPPGIFDPFIVPRGEKVDDRTFHDWIFNPSSGAPPLTSDDRNPVQGPRKLTEYERWVLGPYVYVADLDATTIHQNTRPPVIPEGTEIPAQLWGLTMEGAQIYFPNQPRSFLNRWWLSVLAHELYHVGQGRLGLTTWQGLEATMKYGYFENPIEVSARWKQRQVYEGITKSARDFAKEQIANQIGPRPS
jgi:hypothetical protein